MNTGQAGTDFVKTSLKTELAPDSEPATLPTVTHRTGRVRGADREKMGREALHASRGRTAEPRGSPASPLSLIHI